MMEAIATQGRHALNSFTVRDEGSVTTKRNFKAWAKDNEPVVTFVLAAVGIVGLIWGAARFVFSPPDLAVTIQTTELRLPSSLYRKFNDALNTQATRLGDSATQTMRLVGDFLRDTENFTQVSLVNSSDRSLTHVDLRLAYVQDLSGWAIQ